MWSVPLGYGLSSHRWYCWEVVSCGQFCWDMVCCHVGGTVGRLYHVVSSVGISIGNDIETKRLKLR
jgi:hypothetical protein